MVATRQTQHFPFFDDAPRIFSTWLVGFPTLWSAVPPTLTVGLGGGGPLANWRSVNDLRKQVAWARMAGWRRRMLGANRIKTTGLHELVRQTQRTPHPDGRQTQRTDKP